MGEEQEDYGSKKQGCCNENLDKNDDEETVLEQPRSIPVGQVTLAGKRSGILDNVLHMGVAMVAIEQHLEINRIALHSLLC